MGLESKAVSANPFVSKAGGLNVMQELGACIPLRLQGLSASNMAYLILVLLNCALCSNRYHCEAEKSSQQESWFLSNYKCKLGNPFVSLTDLLFGVWGGIDSLF